MSVSSLTSNINSTSSSSTTTTTLSAKIYQPTINYTYAYAPLPSIKDNLQSNALLYQHSASQSLPLQPSSQFQQPTQITAYQLNQSPQIPVSQFNPYVMSYPYMQYQMSAYPYPYNYASPYMNNNQYQISQFNSMQSQPSHTHLPKNITHTKPAHISNATTLINDPKIRIDSPIPKVIGPRLAIRPNMFDKFNDRKIKW